MASIYYLISSLPTLKADEKPSIEYSQFLDICKASVKPSVYKNLCTLSLNSKKNEIQKEWNRFSLELAEELNYQRKLRLGRNCEEIKNRQDSIIKVVSRALSAKNPLASEQILLEFQFSRIDSFTAFHYFDESLLYAYAIKLKLMERKYSLNYNDGKKEFSNILDAVNKQVYSI